MVATPSNPIYCLADKGSHGAKSEVARKVIPTSSTNNHPIIELRPPEIVLTKITPPKQTPTSLEFDFIVGMRLPKAKSIIVSKNDSLASFDERVRDQLGLPTTGQIRCYKFPLTRDTNILSETTVTEISSIISDKDDYLDFSIRERTVGEAGIVEPYGGIAVEWKGINGTFPMDEDTTTSPESSIHGGTSSDIVYPSGRTLGASPNPFMMTASSRRFSSEKSTLDDDDDSSSASGKILSGPVIAGTYPRSPQSYLRSSSAERYEERYKTGFNSRFSNITTQALKENIQRGTLGLNNLGITLFFCRSPTSNDCLTCIDYIRQYMLHEFSASMPHPL